MNRFLFKSISVACAAVFLTFGQVAFAASAAGNAQAASAARMDAAQIAARNAAARGGLPAWRAVSTLRMTGQLDAGGKKNVKLPFTLTLKRPRKSRLEIQFEQQTALQVYDGSQGWLVRPYLGRNDVEPYTPAQLKSAASSAELDGPLIDYANKGTTIETLGTEQVEGHRAYVLKLTMKDGATRRLWVDASSFLELKIDGEPRVLDGKTHSVTIFYRDYRKENGLVMPHTLETVVSGVKQTHRITIEHVALNEAADDALFGKPPLTVARAAGHPTDSRTR
ncbi:MULTISPECIES: outer membrane lipoprotein-sorting protein [unclassified Burkholderia]|uniref:outer membrane lipoprotein-sorting protein n=1 Tax=unclassified Burkholderia TaxID=2613784 RepID=UPI000F58C1A7|nr:MULTISPECIES: outer membrane lipoprotein-sorting protein [unclassified Burkholderia]RQS03561.1 outer membrane lipoprotein-sorting protein [Burkholderia sp. Bp8991]RQS27733.1 outer membrane lipoprotein-sorting protein [Burkholderia sp. Bp8995]RQS45883.1 outer membrane lipoprotein-sorting protein [Burkholderia sp. Bp8989]